MVGKQMAVKVNPAIAELLHGEERDLIATLEQATGRQVLIYPHPDYHLEEVSIIEIIKGDGEG
jgi:ribonuclease G